MKNLLKYEIRKTMVSKFILLAVTVLVEILFLVGLYKDNTKQQAIAMTVLLFLGVIGVLYIGIQSVVSLHRDMNTRQGYMLFMTPNSSYKILGAKVLENSVTTLVAGAVFFGIGVGNFALVTGHNQDVSETMEILKSVIETLGANLNFNVLDIAIFTLYTLVSWLSVVTLAYFADVLISSVLNGKKHSGILGFALFIALSIAVSYVQSLLPTATGFVAQYAIAAVYYAVILVLTYYGSAKLMDRHLSI